MKPARQQPKPIQRKRSANTILTASPEELEAGKSTVSPEKKRGYPARPRVPSRY